MLFIGYMSFYALCWLLIAWRRVQVEFDVLRLVRLVAFDTNYSPWMDSFLVSRISVDCNGCFVFFFFWSASQCFWLIRVPSTLFCFPIGASVECRFLLRLSLRFARAPNRGCVEAGVHLGSFYSCLWLWCVLPLIKRLGHVADGDHYCVKGFHCFVAALNGWPVTGLRRLNELFR